MKRIRQYIQVMQGIGQAQARWEVSLSSAVFASRRRLLLLCLLTLPALLFVAVEASGAGLAQMPSLLGGSKAYMPSYANDTMFYGSILVGLIAGLITGVIGAGGGYILTPALMSFGVRGIMAVGTDQFHLFAKAIIGTAIHKKLGNVHVGLAAWFVLGSFGGVTLGGIINRTIFQINPAMSDALISLVYVVVLGVLGGYAIYDWRRQNRQVKEAGTAAHTTAFALKLQQLNAPPFVKFDEDIVPSGKRISVYPLIICGFIVGCVASIMGVGGGFLTFPMFVYGLGVSTFTTVGTDILQIVFTTCYSSIFQYAIYGFVFYTVAIGMLLGSLVGVQIGALVTKTVTGSQIRAFYALTIAAGFVNRLCALPRKLGEMGYISLPKPVSVMIEQFGAVVFFAIISVFACWILRVFLATLRKNRTSSQRIVHPRKFAIGLSGMLIFFLIFACGTSMHYNGSTALAWADNLFNQMAKDSADFHGDASKKVAKHAGEPVKIALKLPDGVQAEQFVAQLNANGARAALESDGKLHVSGDLGVLSDAALEDAHDAYQNHGQLLAERYGSDAKTVTYQWWALFNGLSKQSLKQNDEPMVNYMQTMTTKVLEPAYNFHDIRAKSARGLALPVTLLLLFYVLYTVLYGLSIYYVFEGLGITITGFAKKQEC